MKPENNVGLAARVLWLPAMLVVYLGAFASGATRWISTLDDDSRQMEQMARTIGGKKLESSYEVMAFIYAHTSEIQRILIDISAGVLFILYCLGSLRTHRAFLLVSFWLIGPMLLFLMVLNKDTILVFFILAAAVALRSSLPMAVRTLIVSVIYIVYAAMFREYYFLILVIFIALIAFRRMTPLAVIAICFFGVAVASMLPAHVFLQLQESRDIFNWDRIGRNLPGARTAFVNIVQTDSFFHFVLNYVYAAVRLNFPFFSGVTVRDIYLFANVILFAWIVIVGLGRDRKTYDNTALFLSHVLVSICFETGRRILLAAR